MTTAPSRLLLAAACALSFGAPLPAAAAASAGDQPPTAAARPATAASIPDRAPADITKPALTPRIGGSPADAAFRAAIQQSGDEFRERRAACDKYPAAERGPCLREARAALDKARADAKAAHDEAVRSATPLPAAAAASAGGQAPPDVARPAAAGSVPDRAPADITKPALTPRIGGSPADAEFRAVIQQSGDEFRERRAACDKYPTAERGPCLREARAALDKARADAKRVHDEAVRAERGARQQ